MLRAGDCCLASDRAIEKARSTAPVLLPSVTNATCQASAVVFSSTESCCASQRIASPGPPAEPHQILVTNSDNLTYQNSLPTQIHYAW
jgi:hypothetical protein